jgi:hypothetical protein
VISLNLNLPQKKHAKHNAWHIRYKKLDFDTTDARYGISRTSK